MSQRKSTANRRRTGTLDIGLVRQASGKVPPAPKIAGKPMRAAARNAWATFWTSDISSLVVDADLPALERLFTLYDLRERMQAELLKRPFVRGSTPGSTVVHPAAAQVASLDTRITALEDRFGITPSARLKLGIVFGAAAKSLEEMNAQFVDDPDDEKDPRLTVVEVDGRDDGA